VEDFCLADCGLLARAACDGCGCDLEVMLAFLSRQSITVKAIILVIVIALLLGGFYSIQSWAYHRGHAKYIEESKAWQTERAKLIADAEAKERRIAELEPQVVAYKTAAEAGKRLDEDKARQIEELGRKEAEDVANSQIPATCADRARRVCDLFKRSEAKFDCRPIFAECGQ
jgi:hypothetical protein